MLSNIKRWFYDLRFKLRLKIKYFGKKNIPMSEELKVFHMLILKMKHNFAIQNRGIYPDVFILRNKAASMYIKHRHQEYANRSYLEKFMDINPKTIIDTTCLIIAIQEPCLKKPDIEMIRFGTSIRRVHTEPATEDEMGTTTLELINGCEEDQVVTENLL
jgi:hypothetical protein